MIEVIVVFLCCFSTSVRAAVMNQLVFSAGGLYPQGHGWLITTALTVVLKQQRKTTITLSCFISASMTSQLYSYYLEHILHLRRAAVA